MDVKRLQQVACEAIGNISTELHKIGLEIWKNPEESFKEGFAHNLLTTYLKENKFTVTSGCGGLSTAFKAVFSRSSTKKGARVGIICEYDALPEIHHACGHNLIAEAGIAAAMGKQYYYALTFYVLIFLNKILLQKKFWAKKKPCQKHPFQVHDRNLILLC